MDQQEFRSSIFIGQVISNMNIGEVSKWAVEIRDNCPETAKELSNLLGGASYYSKELVKLFEPFDDGDHVPESIMTLGLELQEQKNELLLEANGVVIRWRMDNGRL